MRHHLRHTLSWIIISLIIVFIVILIIPSSKDITDTNPVGNECVFDSDCPKYRCPNVRASCIEGFCKPIDIDNGEVTRCIDLKNPVCGNGVCEGGEKNGSCSQDCA